jgi:hypothetical protein
LGNVSRKGEIILFEISFMLSFFLFFRTFLFLVFFIL